MTTTVSAGTAAGAAAELRRGDGSVRVAIGPGAPITSFVAKGREWCAAGAWRDYAPTSRACALPTFVAGAAGAKFPDGGLLAADEPTVEVRADGAANTIMAWWSAWPYPLAWTRALAFDPDGTLNVRYSVTNGQRAPLPFIWGLPLPFAWSSGVTIVLPRGARSRVAAACGDGLPAAGSEFAWPSLRDGGHLVDLTHPAQLGARRSVLCYVELPRGRFAVRAGDRTLDVSGDPGMVTHARVWVSNGGEQPGAAPRRWWHRHTAQPAMSVGPAVGAPDLLSEAVGAWGAARWINPRETVSWDVRIRGLTTPE